MFSKLKAFTLAELILVMAIIGVVAVLVLPNLNNNVDEKTTVAKLRKVYGEVQTAYSAVVSEYGPAENWFTDSDTSDDTTSVFAERLLSHMQVKTNCETDTDLGCFDENTLDGYGYETMYSAILKDGTSIAFALKDGKTINEGIASSSNSEDAYIYPLGEIFVDLDGMAKGYNRLDYDRFIFAIDIDDIKPQGLALYTGVPSPTAGYTAAWVIKAGNMDYLKCIDQLSWTSKRTCK